MPSLDEVYRKFGETAEAAQLLETELGTTLLQIRGVEDDLIANPRPQLATEILERINKSTLGNLLRTLAEKANRFEHAAELFSKALAERNRLAHSFYRQHNFRRNTDEGRALMIADLEAIHTTILQAYVVALAVGEIDLKEFPALVQPTRHLKI